MKLFVVTMVSKSFFGGKVNTFLVLAHSEEEAIGRGIKKYPGSRVGYAVDFTSQVREAITKIDG